MRRIVTASAPSASRTLIAASMIASRERCRSRRIRSRRGRRRGSRAAMANIVLDKRTAFVEQCSSLNERCSILGVSMRTTYDRRWLILAVILAAECMDLLDATIVNVAAPAIRGDLHTSSTALQWIVGGYALAVACGLILGGRLGDLFGRRQMFEVGTAGFTVASLLCAVAPSSGALVGFRLLQGAAAAVMLPQ